MKGYVRIDEALDKGVYEVTVNSNYVIDRQIKNIQIQLVDVIFE